MPSVSALPAARRAGRTRAARAVLLTTGLALAALTGAACDGGTSPDDPVAGDLVGRLRARERYVPLAEALALTGVDREIASGTFTVLAPTATAFRYVGSDFSPVLFAEPQRAALARVLRHHIVARRLAPEDFADGASLATLAGTTLAVRRVGPVVTVNGVTVDVGDAVEASNGVAYPAADVLLDVLTTAERVRLSPLLATLAQRLRATGTLAEAEALAAVTVLAPLNEAFARGSGPALLAAPNDDVLRRVLRTLVLPGDVDLAARVGQTVTTLAGDRLAVTQDADRVLYVAGVRVLDGETTRNGRFYILADPVLSTVTVAERLRIEPDAGFYALDLLRAPAVAAVLADRSREVTVFAPTNFAYLSRSEALNAILREPPQADLVRRLALNHVVAGRYLPADLTPGLRLTTLDGSVLTVGVFEGAVTIDGRPFASAPRVQANGVAYTTDAFVLPSVDLFDTLILRSFVSYVRAIRQASLEAAYRSTVRTAFVLPDSLATAAFRARPDLAAILRRSATATPVPALNGLPDPLSFTTLGGTTRSITVDPDCTPSRTNPCSPFTLADTRTQIYQGLSTGSGFATFHRLRTVDVPPAP